MCVLRAPCSSLEWEEHSRYMINYPLRVSQIQQGMLGSGSGGEGSIACHTRHTWEGWICCSLSTLGLRFFFSESTNKRFQKKTLLFCFVRLILMSHRHSLNNMMCKILFILKMLYSNGSLFRLQQKTLTTSWSLLFS